MDNYYITLKEAKNMKIYNFFIQKEINKIKEEIENNIYFENNLNDTPIIIEFGNIDIELTIYDDNSVGYFICVKRKEDNEVYWESYDGTNLIFNINHLSSKENIEEIMFNELIRIAKKDKLYYSKFN